MGCMGSKAKAGAEVAVADVYRPLPTSVSLFDISAVEEPWLIAKNKQDDDGDEETSSTDDDEEEEDEDENNKQPMKAVALLDKLEGYELAPASWSEVSRALEDMKPAAAFKDLNLNLKTKKKKTKKKPSVEKVEDIKEKEKEEANQEEEKGPPPELAGRRVVKDNPFLMRDRENTNNTNKPWRRRDPFEGCPERRPPGASGGGVVLYTTTLRGVRRTFEGCERARELVEAACADAALPFDERDVSLHAAFLRELRDLLPGGEDHAPPRLFVMGRYVGGADDCARLADSGRLREMMRWAKARGEASCADLKDGRGCVGCGGARFVPCWECGGSCKVVGGDDVHRCAKCNENGLMMCPICH